MVPQVLENTRGTMVPRQGFEPWTSALPRMRSTTELSRRKARRGYSQHRAPREAPIRCMWPLTGRTPRRTPWAMTPADKTSNKPRSERETKLAQALRANLRRRKAAASGPSAKPADKIERED